jgi:acetyl esterase/lipase
MQRKPDLLKFSLPALVVLVALLCVHAQESRASFRLRRLPRTNFYETRSPLPPGSPGELIRSTPFDRYYLPLDVSAVRFLYHSRSAEGGDIPASGVILFPQLKPPAGGWPVIAWGHSWTGVGRDCAPSLMKNLQHGPLLAMYVHLGYAVVAADYAGLGADARSAFGDMLSNANDMIYSVRAARAALPQLSSRWIAAGTREGGVAAIAVAEQEHDLHDSNYLGSIAFSGLAQLQDFYAGAGASGRSFLLLAYGIKTVFPQFEVNEILRPEGVLQYQDLAGACEAEDENKWESPGKIVDPDWRENPWVKKYFQRNLLGSKTAAEPLLVITSQNDLLIAQTTRMVQRLCQAGDQVDFEKYPESDPGQVIGDSARDQIAWIRSRFASQRTRSNCSEFR